MHKAGVRINSIVPLNDEFREAGANHLHTSGITPFFYIYVDEDGKFCRSGRIHGQYTMPNDGFKKYEPDSRDEGVLPRYTAAYQIPKAYYDGLPSDVFPTVKNGDHAVKEVESEKLLSIWNYGGWERLSAGEQFEYVWTNKSTNWNLNTSTNWGTIKFDNNTRDGEANWIRKQQDLDLTGMVWCSGREDVDAAGLATEEDETFCTTGQCFNHNHAPPLVLVRPPIILDKDDNPVEIGFMIEVTYFAEVEIEDGLNYPCASNIPLFTRIPDHTSIKELNRDMGRYKFRFNQELRSTKHKTYRQNPYFRS